MRTLFFLILSDLGSLRVPQACCACALIALRRFSLRARRQPFVMISSRNWRGLVGLTRWRDSGQSRASTVRRLSIRSVNTSGASPGQNYDVIIAGGGVMGCSAAYFMAQRLPGNSVCIIERDPKVRRPRNRATVQVAWQGMHIFM